MPLVSSKNSYSGAIAGKASLGVTTMPLLLKTDAGQVLMPLRINLSTQVLVVSTKPVFNDGDCRITNALLDSNPTMLKTFLTIHY